MRYYLALFTFFILLSSFAYGNKKITLQLSWKHQFQFAGYYMAKELGYYEEAGLDVQINEFEFGMDLSCVIDERKADFAIGRSSLLIDSVNGKDVVALGAIYQNSPMMLLVRDDSGINTIKDLRGKNIMITSDAKSTASIIAMLNANNIQTTDINIQNHSFNLDDLISKKTDAMASYISNEPIRMEDKGIGYKVFHPKDYGFDFYSDILFTSSKFINENEKLTKDFYEATIKGWKYAFNNIGKTAGIIYKKYNTQNRTLVHLVSEGEALKKLIHHENTTEIGCLDKRKLQKILYIYKVMGIVTKDVDLDKFIYKHNNHKIVNLNLSHNEIYLASLLFILVIIGIVSVIFYFTIKRKWLLSKQELESEVKLKTEELRKLTLIDPLTKASNRKAFDNKMEELITLYQRYDTVFSIALFDIDNFKIINDTYGHKVGDQVLIDLTNLVNTNIRQSDFLYRVGGEEFIIIFSHTPLNEAAIVSRKVTGIIERHLDTIKNKSITVSMGITQISKDDTEDNIYTRADKLMYKSKENGKNQISFE